MYPPAQSLGLDVEALSGICGSVSIACWVVVFSPQIIENFRRSSAEGLSIVFIVVWLLGDVFNILGAVLQGVLPTMIILAVYYTLADVVLLGQCFYYEGLTLKDKVSKPGQQNGNRPEHRDQSNERTPLLHSQGNGSPAVLSPAAGQSPVRGRTTEQSTRRDSASSFRERLLSIDATHLSPVTPLLPEPKPREQPRQGASQSTAQTFVFHSFIVVLVCSAGVLGWYLSPRTPEEPARQRPETLHFNVLGQVFGYVCAVLYLGSRVPQLLLNYRRKSTEGISMLFFLFACIGNLTYVLSIFAYEPICGNDNTCRPGEAREIYGRYILVNLSWLLGSFGTLLLDAGVFVQYFIYRVDDKNSDEEQIATRRSHNEPRVSADRRGARRSISFEDER